MSEETTRRDYQRELKERVTRFCYDAGVAPESAEAFYELVRAECLQSFKNGREMAGKPRHAGKPKSARIETSALQEGKLRRVA